MKKGIGVILLAVLWANIGHATLIEVGFTSSPKDENSDWPPNYTEMDGSFVVDVPSSEALLNGFYETNIDAYTGNTVIDNFSFGMDPVQSYDINVDGKGSFSGTPTQSEAYAWDDNGDPEWYLGGTWDLSFDFQLENSTNLNGFFLIQAFGPLYLNDLYEDPDAVTNFILEGFGKGKSYGSLFLTFSESGVNYHAEGSDFYVSLEENNHPQNSVPVPATLKLFLFGLLSMLFLRRKCKA